MNFARRSRGSWLGSFVVVAAVLTSPRLWVEERLWTLSPQADQWKQLLFLETLEGKVARSAAATFAFGSDPELGGTIAVGPWQAGFYGARLEYRTAYPAPKGTIRGYYRTQGLLPCQASVNVAYYKGVDLLAKKQYNLAPSPSWQPFQVAVRFPPAGADSFRVAFGLSDHTGGRVEFARLTVGERVADLAFPADPPALTRPAPPASFPKGPAFRAAADGGTHWLVTPGGRAFYSVATDGPSGRAGDLPVRTGPEWAAWLRDNGFNSLAGWARISYWTSVNAELEKGGGAPLPLFATVSNTSLGGTFDWLTDALGGTGMSGHGFPDPYDPAFEAAYRAAVQGMHAYLAGKSWFVGWFAANEVDHADLARRVWSPHCAEAFKAFLVGRYATIAALNQAWKSGYGSFEELIAARPDPILPAGAMAEDFRLFSREVVARYIDVTIRSIRASDPERLIFSNRFMASGIHGSAEYLDLYARYDGIAANLYPQNQQPGLSENERAYLRLFNERTGKPVIVTEWSVPALDSGLYAGDPAALDWSWNEAVGTQAERAAQAARVTAEFHNLPFVVGAHWYTWKDFEATRLANRGLLTAAGVSWEELLRQLKAVQQRIVAP